MRFLASKTLAIVGVTIVLLFALGSIRGVVQDRQRYQAEAVEEVSRSTAGAQSLEGPVLVVPYSDRVVTTQVDPAGHIRQVDEVKNGSWLFFPKTLDVRGTMRPQVRNRGLYEVRVFELDARVSASFAVRIPVDDDPSSVRTIGEPRLGFGICDVRGLVGMPSLRVQGAPVRLLQGDPQGRGGLHVLLAPPAAGSTLALDLQFDAVMQGTESLSIVPLATSNVIALDSTWPHPQFHGDFLPRKRSIGPAGFTARWEISSLASSAQSQYTASSKGAAGATDALSVSLVDPVNAYSKVDRATKYGVLFVLLTFVAFFMFELLRRLRIHPIQYGLVGLAVAIFFLLLLAASERIAFGLAYIAASLACVALIGYYLSHVLGGWVRGAGFAAMLGTLYAALYGLLISEDNALILGAGLLFVILAAIMVVTRRVDWYGTAAS